MSKEPEKFSLIKQTATKEQNEYLAKVIYSFFNFDNETGEVTGFNENTINQFCKIGELEEIKGGVL